MQIRKVLFWLHLILGTAAGIVILIMSVTGVALMYERQILAWADRGFWSEPPPGAEKLPIETVLGKLSEQRRGIPSSITVRSDPAAPVEAVFDRSAPVYINPYTGAVAGEGSKGVRQFFRLMTDWHRWLGMEGEGRAVGRAITGACNLAFFFLVVTGFYLWWPRKWTWHHVRAVTWFRGGLTGKARDFNWHNVIGFWSAVPLFFVVLGGVVISYPWATRLIYTLTGSEAPAQPQRRPGPPPGGRAARPTAPVNWSGLNAAFAAAEQAVPGWETITLRLSPSGRGPLSFTVDQSHRGRPDKRTQLTVDRRTGEVVQRETFDDFNRGRKIRTWLRWIHTGEAGGFLGQTLAGLVSAGAAVLVWTGIALSWRRFRAWRSRRAAREEVAVTTAT